MSVEARETLKQQSETNGVERVSDRPVYRPPVDIVETDKAVVLTADMPGVDEASVEITLENDVLSIAGRIAPPACEGYTLARCEYGVGDFERSFTISNEIDRDAIEATVRDGVLSITLPKARQAVAKKISVKAGP